MRITRATNQSIKFACMHYHYAKAVPVNPIGYNIYNSKDEYCGVVLFGTGANIHIGNEYNLPQGGVLELVRVALNGKQEITSQAVMMSIKQLKKDCPLCRLIVSYADIDQNHLGTIYQATNWIYTGETSKGTKKVLLNGKKTHLKSIYSKRVIVDGVVKTGIQKEDDILKYFDNAEIVHSLGKRKYLMPLDKRMRKQIMPLSKPYPKRQDDNWQKIDRNIFKHKENEQ